MRWKLIGALTLAATAMTASAGAADDFDRALAAIEAYDYPRALAPLRAAAAQGDRRAQRLLGFMLLHGEQLYRGIDTNPGEGVAWLRKASAQGDEHAAVALARIERHLVVGTAK
jgi:TPR repeat protein